MGRGGHREEGEELSYRDNWGETKELGKASQRWFS